MPDYTLLEGDCLESLKTLADNSVDAVVTDPPYHLTANKKGDSGVASVNLDSPYGRARIGTGNGPGGFMGKAWDGGDIAFRPELWFEVLRVLKPGGHLASFSSTRTYHRMACAIEDAGFEVRDQLAWTYGQGFPKSLDVSKAIDKAAGAEREVVGVNPHARPSDGQTFVNMSAKGHDPFITAPATDAARQWDGWGTALKPAWEPICLARKPLSEKTVAANVLRWGTGVINIDVCRVGTREKPKTTDPKHGGHDHNCYGAPSGGGNLLPDARWPANLCHDGSDEVLDLFPETKSAGHFPATQTSHDATSFSVAAGRIAPERGMDTGSAARFFYCAKASKGDRAGSKHPTVKPVKLMQWLCRLITPSGGTILDPFAGSGTTGLAARLEGFRSILCEREAEYIADIRNRMDERAGLMVAAE